jgi:hypothetical protein
LELGSVSLVLRRELSERHMNPEALYFAGQRPELGHPEPK